MCVIVIFFEVGMDWRECQTLTDKKPNLFLQVSLARYAVSRLNDSCDPADSNNSIQFLPVILRVSGVCCDAVAIAITVEEVSTASFKFCIYYDF